MLGHREGPFCGAALLCALDGVMADGPVVVVAKHAVVIRGGHVAHEQVRSEVADAISAGRVGLKRPRFVDPADDFILSRRGRVRWVWNEDGTLAYVVAKKQLVDGVAWYVLATMEPREVAA